MRLDGIHVAHCVNNEGHAALWLGCVQFNLIANARQINGQLMPERIAPDPHEPDERPVARMVARSAFLAASPKNLAETTAFLLRVLELGNKKGYLLKEL